MNKTFKELPESPSSISGLDELKATLEPLIGQPFKLVSASRTNGSNVRKRIAGQLETATLPAAASGTTAEIVPPKKKGVPKITLEFIDTYIVTSGTSYNLQVWNRIPDSDTLLIRYENGEALKCDDVRFVFVKIDIGNQTIESIVIASVAYIVDTFGKFGIPTVKHQMLISSKVRKSILESANRILFYKDSKKLSYLITDSFSPPDSTMVNEPTSRNILSIRLIKTMVAEKLIGFAVPPADTKTRGQVLERKVLELLGYRHNDGDLLYGAFPDIPNQLLEVKIQDTQTVDLGLFTPEKAEIINKDLGLTTFDVRYLIALTNPVNGVIEGVILSPGERLGDLFSYVSDQS